MWRVVYLPEAEQERGKLPGNERAALYNAVRKLQSIGPALGYPHTSAVAAAPGLRELRPRRGNSPWRGIYRQVKLVLGPQRRGFCLANRWTSSRISSGIGGRPVVFG